jgi:hypothetical protein
MAALQKIGAAAPGLVTPERPERDDAPDRANGRGVKVQGTADSPDCADIEAGRKLIATCVARAALLGIEVHELPGGAWLLQHASGASIGVVRGQQGLRSPVRGFEAARNDVADLVRQIGARPPAADASVDGIAALRNGLQRAGWTLSRPDPPDGPASFLVARWGRVRELPDLATVEAFAIQVGARPAA